MEPKRFFISYAHATEHDRRLADRFYQGLREAGHEVYMDRDIPIGADWSRWIDERLAACDFLVVLLSAEAVASDMVIEEVGRAHRRLRETGSPQLFPVRVAFDQPLEYALAGYLRRYQSKTWRTVADTERLLEEILAVAEGRMPVPGPVLGPAAGEERWSTLLERSIRQSERFLGEARSGRHRSDAFIPDLQVRRAAVESRLGEYLDGEAPGLVLIGDSGVGKTSLLCRWTLDLREADHGVFFYTCGGSLDPDIEREIARDLAPEEPESPAAGLRRAEALAKGAGRRFVLIFDGVDEFRGDGGPEALLKRIDALIGRLPGDHLRVVLSCGGAAWNRLRRLDALRLYWSRYAGGEALRLEPFTAAELQDAYPRYQAYFELGNAIKTLPPGLRERLRNPLLLRMFAETYRGRNVPVSDRTLALDVYRRYYEERVRRRRDQLFLDRLVAEMYRQSRPALLLSGLIRHPELGSEILDEGADSSYQRLLDEGVLSETAGDLSAGDSTLHFTHARVGAYCLARHLHGAANRGTTVLAELVARAGSFPPAWDAARMWLLLGDDRFDAITAAAGSADSELRELAAESLAELDTSEPRETAERLRTLLASDAPEARRTALKAAHYAARQPGSGAREVFLWAAESRSPPLRLATRDALYLIWRKDPEFAYDTLHALLERLTLGNLLHFRRILEFVIDLSITIYVNHPDRPEVIEQTDRLYHELATRRLHLNLFNTGILGPAFEKLVIRAFAAAFARPILDTMLFTELVPADRFFALPREQRACLKRIAPLLDPDADLEPARTELAAMLQSEVLFFNVVAALTLAIHACRDFPRTRPLLDRLFEELDGSGRMWELLGFSVLLPDTPRDWIGLLEDYTSRLVRDHPEQFHGGLLVRFDIVFVPLGLAYGKQGRDMPLFAELIRRGLQDDDPRLVTRCLRALGPVGFYYPEAVFATLEQVLPALRERDLEHALRRPLAIMRTLHLDQVDRFLQGIGPGEDYRRRVAAEADIDLVHRYIRWLGLYNNAVHFSLHYPRMRRTLSQGALRSLAEVNSPTAFVADYTTAALRMFRESGFRLREWTRSE